MASNKHRTPRLQWLAPLIWAIVLLILSTLPTSRLPKIRNWTDWVGVDKLAHLLVYAVFAVLLYLPLRGKRINTGLWSVVIAALYGVGMEFLQATLSTGRGYDPADMLANLIGALLGWLLIRWLLSLRKENELLNIFKPKSK